MSAEAETTRAWIADEIAAMWEGVGRRLAGLVKIAEGLDAEDPDQLADRAWLVGAANDVSDLFDAVLAGGERMAARVAELEGALRAVRPFVPATFEWNTSGQVVVRATREQWLKARAVLSGLPAEPQRQAVEGYVDGMRERTLDVCWRLLEGGYCCVLDRGHDDGVHEPSGLPAEEEPDPTVGLPPDLVRALRDPTIVLGRDLEVRLADGRSLHEHLEEWRNAPSNTASSGLPAEEEKP